MLDYDAKTNGPLNIRPIKIGDLVFVNSIFNDIRKCKDIGIIIGCRYGFGFGISEWIVLLNGKVSEYNAGVLWPIEEVLYEKI
tara:strand:+ start:1409 stop:1657 length:249 start_codon:yes stop_codon:yes gene_type:complete